MSIARFKSNKAKVAVGLRPVRFKEDGTMHVLTDMAAERFSEIYLDNGAVTLPPMDPVDPIVPPPPPIDTPPPTPVDPVNAGNVAALNAALAAATGGEIIALAPGNYGDFSLASKAYATPVKLTSLDPASPATFRSLSFSRVENLIIDGLAVVFTPVATTSSIAAGIGLVNCKRVTIANCKAKSGPMPTDGLLTGRGISVLTSIDIALTGNDISQFRRGIMTGQVDGLVIGYNWIHDNRTSLLSGGGIDNALIEGNHLERSNPNNFGGTGDHGDFIHYWTSSTQTKPSDNIVIRNNFIEQGGGTALLGIYMDNNSSPHGFTNVTIENNVLHNSNGQGVRLEDVIGGVVRNNTLLQCGLDDFRKAPRIRVEDGCRDIQITNNIVSNYLAGVAAVNAAALNIVENGTVQLPEMTAVAAQAGKFVGLPKDNGTLADMQQIPGAFPAGVGATLTPAMIYPARRA